MSQGNRWIVFLALAAIVACTSNRVTVALDAPAVTVPLGGTHTFTATVRGTTDPRVVWSATAGTVTGSGLTVLYTAPTEAGEYEVTVASVADPAASATAAVTVMPGVALWTHLSGTEADEQALGVDATTAGKVIFVGETDGQLADTHMGGLDAFARVLDPDGSVAWTHQFGTAERDVAWAVTWTAAGAVVVGETAGNLAGEQAGAGDAFLLALADDGTRLWTRQFGTAAADVANAVAVDPDGNVLVAGLTNGDLDGPNAGDADAFVRKYDPGGNLIWGRQIGTDRWDSADGVAADADGRVWVVGTVDGVLLVPPGSYDVFVRVYDADGVELWTRQFVYQGGDFAAPALAIDPTGRAVIGGQTYSDMVSVPEEDVLDGDAFVHVLDPDGETGWVRQFGTDAEDRVWGVAVDGAGRVVAAGYTGGSLAESNAGEFDAFVRTFDSEGNVLWTRQFGTERDDTAFAVAVDGAGNVIVAGSTRDPVVGTRDAFVRRFSP